MKIITCQATEKKSQMLRLLKDGTVMLFLDSRHQNVMVPENYKGDFQLRLNFDYAFQINDFRVLTDRVEASLSFNQHDFFCKIPFDAVYLMINHQVQEGSLFIESIPNEMLEIFAGMQPDAKEKSRPTHIQSVPNTKSPAPKMVKDKKPKQKKPHLRVVK